MTATAESPVPATGRPATQLANSRARLEKLAGRSLADPGAMHASSVEHVGDFWRELLHWSQLPWSGTDEVALTGDHIETARFFPGVRLNYTEALLQPLPNVHDHRPALTSVHDGRPAERWTQRRHRIRRSSGMSGDRAASGDIEQRFFAGSQEAAAFQPAPYEGTVSYYLAATRLPVVNSLSARRRVAPHLVVTEVPGRHMDTDDTGDGVLGRQHVATLAAHVSADLTGARPPCTDEVPETRVSTLAVGSLEVRS